ncbi:MAG: HAMP domain-containing sensor histidine kinase [Thermodesulfovibrionales bacterium]|jgi:signal transduction histidine kinase|nr:HAMP domain-containing sensor histidine kinase [Thermodesulfovibrionales bacterium]
MSSFFNYYRIGRFIFALALLISFQIAGLPYAIPRLMFILAVYSFLALLRLAVFTKKIHYFDFLLDIVFISAIVYISFGIYSYLTLLYLFPIFFSSVIIKTKKIFLFPVISAVLYGASYYISGVIAEKESILNISLHFLSFSLIALAGDNLKERMEKQEQHIKDLEEEKIKMKGYERLYRVSADLAHELKNPLASISAAAQFLNEGKNDREFIDMLSTETKRLTTLVNDFLLFSRPSDAPKEDVDLSETLKSLVNRQNSDKNSDKKITLNVINDAEVVANRTFIEVALNNIIRNAIEAAKSEVKISLKKVRSLEFGVQSLERILIEIEDDGTGIDDDMKDKIFEPFVTTKTNGTGLGLAIAYRIITGFGGNIIIDRSSLGGAKFKILFPAKG